MKKVMFSLGFCVLIFTQSTQTFAQNSLGQDTTRRVITTAVPFLAISPDSRASGMGDVGVATSPDANASYWNPAKVVFMKQKFGASLSISPWLAKLVGDMYLYYLSGYYKIDDNQALDLGMTYFNLGSIDYRDAQNQELGTGRPREFAFRAHYSRKLSDNFSVGVGGFYVNSNVAAGLQGTTAQPRAGNSGGVDLGIFYQKKGVNVADLMTDLSFGVNVSNLGAKISYSGNNQRDFLPTNFRLGGAGTVSLDAYNKLTIAADFNKLLVPTPPLRDGQGNIVKGKDSRDITLLSGLFGSFSDAPGGFSEEMQEWVGNFGLEYNYNDLFFARAGYATEHKNKGDRKYFSAGIGARYQVFGLDVAYLIPTKRGNPLAETLRFTLMVNFNAKDGSTPPDEK
jgi:hypothetical protein